MKFFWRITPFLFVWLNIDFLNKHFFSIIHINIAGNLLRFWEFLLHWLNDNKFIKAPLCFVIVAGAYWNNLHWMRIFECIFSSLISWLVQLDVFIFGLCYKHTKIIPMIMEILGINVTERYTLSWKKLIETLGRPNKQFLLCLAYRNKIPATWDKLFWNTI